MTRHGTIAYYLAAWIIGCPVAGLLYWLIGAVRAGSASSSALFEICFFALMAGAADSLLFAFLLRRVMHWTDVRSTGIWSLAGAVLSLALVFLLALASYKVSDSPNGFASFANTFLLAGPRAIWNSGWWQLIPDGAGLAAVLGLIDRAFHATAVKVQGVAGPPRPGAAAQT